MKLENLARKLKKVTLPVLVTLSTIGGIKANNTDNTGPGKADVGGNKPPQTEHTRATTPPNVSFIADGNDSVPVNVLQRVPKGSGSGMGQSTPAMNANFIQDDGNN